MGKSHLLDGSLIKLLRGRSGGSNWLSDVHSVPLWEGFLTIHHSILWRALPVNRAGPRGGFSLLRHGRRVQGLGGCHEQGFQIRDPALTCGQGGSAGNEGLVGLIEVLLGQGNLVLDFSRKPIWLLQYKSPGTLGHAVREKTV